MNINDFVSTWVKTNTLKTIPHKLIYNSNRKNQKENKLMYQTDKNVVFPFLICNFIIITRKTKLWERNLVYLQTSVRDRHSGIPPVNPVLKMLTKPAYLYSKTVWENLKPEKFQNYVAKT